MSIDVLLNCCLDFSSFSDWIIKFILFYGINLFYGRDKTVFVNFLSRISYDGIWKLLELFPEWEFFIVFGMFGIDDL